MSAKKSDSKVERAVTFIDGSNLYHYLKSLGLNNLLDFDYSGLLDSLLADRKIVSKTYYVGAVREEQGSRRSKQLLSGQMKLFSKLRKTGFEISLGYMLKTDGYHEKGVDVKIATDLLVGAYEDLYDTAILVSSDTDLLPVVDKIGELGKKVEYVGFGHRPSFAMQKHATLSRLLIKEDLLPFANQKRSKTR